MTTDATFYTDANGREMQKRKQEKTDMLGKLFFYLVEYKIQ